MTSYATTRKIAYLIAFAKEKLKDVQDRGSSVGKRLNAELSDERLAGLLMRAQAVQSRKFTFTRENVNQLLHGKIDLDVREEHDVLQAFQSLFSAHGVDGVDVLGPLPKWLEERHANDLRELLRESHDPIIHGEELGSLAKRLAGLWQCFYVRPMNKPEATEPRLQGFALHFRPASNTRMNVEFIAHDRSTTGAAYAMNRHLYILLSDPGKTNVSMLVVNQPGSHSLAFAGTGIGLARPVLPQNLPSAAAFVCFGQKCGDDLQDKKEILSAVESLARAETLSEAQQRALRDFCCMEYDSIDAFKANHATLHTYIQGHEINGALQLPKGGLFVKYP